MTIHYVEPVDNPSHEDHGAAEGPDAVEPVVNILHVHVPSYRVTELHVISGAQLSQAGLKSHAVLAD